MIKLQVLVALAIFALPTVAQDRPETLHLTNGTTVTGTVVKLGEHSVTLARRLGEGSVRQVIKFKRIQSNSLYALLTHQLAPLDTEDHLRIAGVAQKAGLYPTASRHYRTAAEMGGGMTDALAEKIAECTNADVKNLMAKSNKDLEREHFSHARKMALLIMRRYPDHPAAKTVPQHLDHITKLHDEAKKREAALARSRRAREAWQKAEKALNKVKRWLVKAERAETTALRATSRFSQSRNTFQNAIRYLRAAENAALKVRKSKILPPGLRGELVKVEESVVAMHIRTRLHIASLYSVRGSYGSALSYVNAALAYDPTDQSALQARARIEEGAAAAASRGWANR